VPMLFVRLRVVGIVIGRRVHIVNGIDCDAGVQPDVLIM
jgi:hypothetical protein